MPVRGLGASTIGFDVRPTKEAHHLLCLRSHLRIYCADSHIVNLLIVVVFRYFRTLTRL